MRSIDINCDLGESFGNWSLGHDDQIMREVTSANVACGFHGGDPVTMLRTVALAREHGVAVGAHPGFPDLLGFGRRMMALSPDDARAYVLYQVGALREALRANGMELHHVKPHGAFFTLLRDDPEVGRAAAEAVVSSDSEVLVYWPAPVAGAAFCDAVKERGVRVVGEVYPDLTYDEHGKLVLQRAKHHTDVQEAVQQVMTFLEQGKVRTTGGELIPLEAESICIHGDGPNAVEVAQAIRGALHGAGCRVEAAQASDTRAAAT